MLPLDRQNFYRARYRALVPGWCPATEVFAAAAWQYAGPGTRVLDVGCGRGGLIERLAPAVRPRGGLPAGLDPDQASLGEHRQALTRRARGLLERLPYAEGQFDLVISSWVFEHLARPEAALAEVARVLAPGGHLVFLTPNARHPVVLAGRLARGGWQSRLVRAFYGRAEDDTFPTFYRANTPGALERLAHASGLRRIALDCIPDPTYLAFNAALFGLSMTLERLLPASLRVHLVGDYLKPGS